MALQSTWLVVEHGSTPASQVARRTLRKRLDAVWTELQAAAGERPDADRVHRLRVATRRTLAALDVFAALLPAKRRDWFAKRLRRLTIVAIMASALPGRTGSAAKSAAGVTTVTARSGSAPRPRSSTVARIRTAMPGRRSPREMPPVTVRCDTPAGWSWAK